MVRVEVVHAGVKGFHVQVWSYPMVVGTSEHAIRPSVTKTIGTHLCNGLVRGIGCK